MAVAAESGGGAALEFEEHHEAGEGEHGDEEEEIVANDGTDEAHLGGAGGEDAVFAEFVQAADDELEGDEVEDDGGDAEEALQVDLDAAADEEDAEDDGYGDAEEGSGEAEEFGGVEGDGGEDEDGLDAFAEDEEEDEEEEADFGDACRAGVLCDFLFDVAFHGAGGAMHEPDHADDEDGGSEHDPAFEDVGVVRGVGQDDSSGDTGGYGRAQCPEDGALELGAADFAEVGEDDANDQRCFYSFTEGDDKCLQHKVFLFSGAGAAGAAKRPAPGVSMKLGLRIQSSSSVLRTKLVVNCFGRELVGNR